MLRNEIEARIAFSERLILATAAANFAILSFSFGVDRGAWLVALLTTTLSTISYHWQLSYIYSGFRIARYIAIMESRLPGLGWETWLANPDNRKGKKHRIDRFRLYIWSFYLISLAVAMYHTDIADFRLDWIKILGVMVPWSAWIILSYLLIIGPVRKKIMEEAVAIGGPQNKVSA